VIANLASKALIGGGNVDTISAAPKFLANTDFIATLYSLVAFTHWCSPSLVEIDFGVETDFEIALIDRLWVLVRSDRATNSATFPTNRL
jgi:hypothetical protein